VAGFSVCCTAGGVSGSVELVASQPREWYDMLATLQEGLKKVSRDLNTSHGRAQI
jgi:hypothetical protein